MRDPNRIPRVLALLGEVWQKSPDLRLGQLVYNATRHFEGGYGDSVPVFGREDDEMEKALLEMLSRPTQEQLPAQGICSDCPPIGYPTDKTRCDSCPAHSPAPEVQ